MLLNEMNYRHRKKRCGTCKHSRYVCPIGCAPHLECKLVEGWTAVSPDGVCDKYKKKKEEKRL